MTANQSPEMLDELLRVTAPAQPRLNYETLRARYEWLCSNLFGLHIEGLSRGGFLDEGPVTATKLEPKKYGGRMCDPASVDALVAQAMKEQAR